MTTNLVQYVFDKSALLKGFLIFWCVLMTNSVSAQIVKNEFFALHNIIRGDSTYDTFEKQVAFIKKAGYDGIEINQVGSFAGMNEALNKNQFRGSYFYVKVKLEEPYIDERLESYIDKLKGSGTIIAPFVVSESKKFLPSDGKADTFTVHLLKQIGSWAAKAGLEVAIYPHFAFYVERTAHALKLVREIGMKNVGMSFNLCHWLATTPEGDRENLRDQLKQIRPYLKMITVSGANDVVTNQKMIWDDYILPLGEGSFDTYGLIRFIVRDLKFTGPVGVQCFNIKGNKPALALNTIKIWGEYKSRLETDK